MPGAMVEGLRVEGSGLRPMFTVIAHPLDIILTRFFGNIRIRVFIYTAEETELEHKRPGHYNRLRCARLRSAAVWGLFFFDASATIRLHCA